MAPLAHILLLSVLAASAAAAPAAQFNGGNNNNFGNRRATSTATAKTSSTSVAKGTPIQVSTSTSTSTSVAKGTPIQVSTSTSTSAQVAKTTTTAKASSTVPATTTVAATGAGKRGIAYNTATFGALFTSAPKVTWGYNWGQYSDSLDPHFDYVPLLWGTNSAFTSGWVAAANYEISVGSTHLMSFNEPDLASQSNLSPADAASAYLTYMQPYAGKAKLGSPAVTNGGSSTMGLAYLSSFFSACSTCTIDFVPIHWYNNVGTNQDFKDHVTAAHTQTGKPIWVTEFGLNSPATDADIISFLDDVLPWLDAQPFVERYAYFYAAPNYLLNSAGTALSDYGSVFATY